MLPALPVVWPRLHFQGQGFSRQTLQRFIESHRGIELCLASEPLGPFKLMEWYSILTRFFLETKGM